MIAALLVQAVGSEDKVFRIGGEEFAILCAFPHALGKLLGESIRQSVVATSQTRATPCSVSIGVATVDGQIRCLADLFALADQRLYAAKDGRTRSRRRRRTGRAARPGRKSCRRKLSDVRSRKRAPPHRKHRIGRSSPSP